ncbi:hypothetical protein [Phytohabitans houttuyneae]|uniref:DUF946 domain-containing protein n=1 Tax=Phytohabitans houttuyneae TaxID=1076126 RepID=A0A6V8K2T6_9ACTN|nr:hypothetical protein [Phytohabitans houttuyneae]GFJ76097.1 hypothetical protein Phou_002770 [Phytohabitans houttuyneae]
MRWVLAPALAAAGLLAAGGAPARADLGDETALAQRYAPVVRLVQQDEECGYGEPYRPMDVGVLFGQSTVALRGPWTSTDLVKIGPSASDLSAGRYEYHLDFPGNPLHPGCGYERWADRVNGGTPPAVYAHVATDPGYPGQVALQYWFFYAFNDFNNTHEGDWEMIQLVFDAPDAAGALEVEPEEVGYSQHEGAERAEWGDRKLEIVDGTHPVVHPAAGSHANFFEDALYLGSSGSQGVGCDDATSPSVELRPVVKVIPSDPAAAGEAFPWITFEGRWGELQTAFYNGPTGPNLKRQWTEPIAYAQDWRGRSYAVPAGGLLGTGATDFFCAGLRAGSDALRRTVDQPERVLLVAGIVAAFALYLVHRTRFRPAAPLRVARRRAWGQILAASAHMYLRRWHLFGGIGLAVLPIAGLVALLQWLALGTQNVLGIDLGGSGGVLATLPVVVGATVTLAGLGLVQAATARALTEVDEGRPIGPVRAYAMALRHLPRLLGAVVIAVTSVVVLGATLIGLPVAVWLAGRWSLVGQVIVLEGDPAPREPRPDARVSAATVLRALRRSSELVRGRWWKVAWLVVAGAGIFLALGPLVGFLLIFATDASFALVNIVAGVVYAVTLPFVALVTTYVYHDAAVSESIEPRKDTSELPSELPAPA